MCLIALALDHHPRYRLVLAANRDEYFNRPSVPARFWDDAPQVLAGRDLRSGGTWLGITTTGRLAAVTNYREPLRGEHPSGSRGRLVADYLVGTMPPEAYLERVSREGNGYHGFNLVFGDASGLFYYSNRGGCAAPVAAGIHGLSNHLLDTPWPKVAAAKERLEKLILHLEIDPEELFHLISDSTTFPDNQLPDTGVGPERERLLSSLFIAGSDYGTRSSTIVLIGRDNCVTFLERSYDSSHEASGTGVYSFEICGNGRAPLL